MYNFKHSSQNPVSKTLGTCSFQLTFHTETCISSYTCAVKYSEELSICHSSSYFSRPVKPWQKRIWGVQIAYTLLNKNSEKLFLKAKARDYTQ